MSVAGMVAYHKELFSSLVYFFHIKNNCSFKTLKKGVVVAKRITKSLKSHPFYFVGISNEPYSLVSAKVTKIHLDLHHGM